MVDTANPSIKVVFHPHKFKHIGVLNSKWYCDGLTNNPTKKCYSGQKAVFEVQKEAQYKCESGCNITLCKPCIESLTDYQVPKVKTYHPHELHYRISTFRKWYCDGLAEKGTCERNHKKEFLVRSHPFYECLDGCNYMLCDSCASKYDVNKQYSAQPIEEEKTKPIQPRKNQQKNVEREEKPKTSGEATQRISPQLDQTIKAVDYRSLPLTKATSLSDVSWLKQNFGDDLRVIGKGGFGEVFLGTRKENGGDVDRAVKVMETMDVTILNQSIQELMNLSRLKNHPNIMSYENYFMNPIPLANGKVTYQIFIEMELATSSLDKMIEQNKEKLPEDITIEILGQILNGLRYAHSQQCAHLDLKPENVLVAGKTMKIADWGGSLILKSGSSTKLKSKSLAVTRGYVAPEIDCEEFGSTETFNYYLCDVYSLGILCFRCCGVPIKEIAGIPKNKQKFHDATMEDFISDYLEGKFSKDLIALIKQMTVFEPSKRPNIQQIIDLYHKSW